MTQVIKWAYLVTLAVWIGSIVFFSLVIAPTVHRTLKPEDAAALLRKLFVNYYLVGIVCAGLGVGLVGILLADRTFGKWPGVMSLLLLAMMGTADVWLRQSVVPQMNELRDQRAGRSAAGRSPEPQVDSEWQALHRLSVQLNLAVLLAALVLLFLVVFSRVA